MAEDIKAMYERLEAEGMTRTGNRGEKAEKVRTMIRDIAKQTKKPKLLMAGAFNTCKELMKAENPDAKLDRPYFTQVVSKVWATEKDDEGRIWILVNKEVTAEAKAAKPKAE